MPIQRKMWGTQMPWWLNTWSPQWSVDEMRIWRRIWAMSIPLLLATYFPMYGILNLVGMDPHISVLAAGVIAFPISMYSARGICRLVWPIMVARADQKAAKRSVGPALKSSLANTTDNQRSEKRPLFKSIAIIGICSVASVLFLISDFLPTPYRIGAVFLGVGLLICLVFFAKRRDRRLPPGESPH
jgi:hypothetical protein